MTLVVEYYLGSSNGVRLLVLFRIRRNKCSQPVRIAVTSFHVYSDSYLRCYSVRCLRANESLTVNLRSLYSAKVHVTPVFRYSVFTLRQHMLRQVSICTQNR